MQPVSQTAPCPSYRLQNQSAPCIAWMAEVQQLLQMQRPLTQEESDRCMTCADRTVTYLSAQPSLTPQLETILQQALLVPINIGFHQQDFGTPSPPQKQQKTHTITALVDGVYEMLALRRPLTIRESAQCLETAHWVEQQLFQPLLDPTMKPVLEKALLVPFEIASHHHTCGGPTQHLVMKA